jgi:hypothetical protein
MGYKVGDKVNILQGGRRGQTATVDSVQDDSVDLNVADYNNPLRYGLAEISLHTPAPTVHGFSEQPYEVVIPVGTKFGAEQVLRLLVQDNPGIEAYVRKAV